MLKRIMSPFRCCLSPPSIPVLIPAPIPLPDPIPEPSPIPEPVAKVDMLEVLLAELEAELETEEDEEEIDPTDMLKAFMAAPRWRPFQPTLDTIVEDPEAEAEAMRADQLDILKAGLEMQAQAIRAEAELQAQAIRAEVEEDKIAPDMEAAPKKRRKNWMKRLLNKCKRKAREEKRRS